MRATRLRPAVYAVASRQKHEAQQDEQDDQDHWDKRGLIACLRGECEITVPTGPTGLTATGAFCGKAKKIGSKPKTIKGRMP